MPIEKQNILLASSKKVTASYSIFPNVLHGLMLFQNVSMYRYPFVLSDIICFQLATFPALSMPVLANSSNSQTIAVLQLLYLTQFISELYIHISHLSSISMEILIHHDILYILQSLSPSK